LGKKTAKRTLSELKWEKKRTGHLSRELQNAQKRGLDLKGLKKKKGKKRGEEGSTKSAKVGMDPCKPKDLWGK